MPKPTKKPKAKPAKKTTKRKGKNKGGRPTKVTPAIVKKLEEAFMIGASDSEACLNAGISRTTLHNYQTKHPEFVNRKEDLKNQPLYKARVTIEKNLHDPKIAAWYLERKRRAEFATKVETQTDGKIEIAVTKSVTKPDQPKTNAKAKS